MKQHLASNQNHIGPLSQHSTSRNCQSVQLKSIMKDVKNLQKYIQQLNIFQETEQSRIVPATPNNTLKMRSTRNTSKCNKEPSNKCQQLKQNSVRTIRNEHSLLKNDSLLLKHAGQTCPLNNCFLSLKKAGNGQARNDMVAFPEYVSLQMQNLKLEKQNLYLEKKLLQQQLLMERREKQLLKNRLKRIKTFNSSSKREEQRPELVQKQKTASKCPQVNAFDISPIKINISSIPDESVVKKKNKKDHNNRIASKISQNLKDGQNQEELIDSLLLSESNRSQRRQLKGVFEKEGWQFMQTRQRQALGDIANCITTHKKK